MGSPDLVSETFASAVSQLPLFKQLHILIAETCATEICRQISEKSTWSRFNYGYQANKWTGRTRI